MRTFTIRSIPVGFLLASIAGVGCAATDGDHSGGDESDLTAPSPPPSLAPQLDADEIAFIKKLNAYRVTQDDVRGGGKLIAFTVSHELVRAARKHSREMADLNAVNATHNDKGKSDQGALREEARRALSARITATGYDEADQLGEDCARREDIGSGAAAFALMRENLADTGTPGFTAEADFDTAPNMLSHYFSTIGVARAQGSNGKWYWTVTYGIVPFFLTPPLSLDDSAEQSLLTNGSFEEEWAEEVDGPVIAKGSWNNVSSWEYAQHWHGFAGPGGSVAVREDNAFVLPGTVPTGKLHGVRIVNAAGPDAMSNLTQIVRGAAGVNYELTARARKIDTSSNQQTAYLDFIDEKYQRIAAATVPAGTQSYWSAEPVRVSATAPQNTRYVRIIMTASSGQASTYDWDDMRLRAW